MSFIRNYIMNKQNGIKEENNVWLWMKSIRFLYYHKPICSKIFIIFTIFLGICPTLNALVMEYVTRQLMNLKMNVIDFLFPLFIFCSLVFLENILRVLKEFCIDKDKIILVKAIRENILWAKCNKAYSEVEQRDELNQNIIMASNLYEFTCAGKYVQIFYEIEDIIVIIISNIMLAKINLSIMLLSLLSCFPLLYVSIKKNKDNYYFETDRIEDREYENYYRQVCTEEKYFSDIRYLKLFDYFKHKWKLHAEEYCKRKNYFLKRYLFIEGIAIVIKNSIFGIILALYLIGDVGATTLPEFVLIISLIKRIQDSTLVGAEKINDFISIKPYLYAYFNFIKIRKRPLNCKRYKEQYEGFICFENVNFKYPKSDKYCLHGFNLKIKIGEKLAIVGENGSGKSTIIKLLCGLIKPESGHIYIDGYEVSEELWDEGYFSAVFQDFARYDDTIERNITFKTPVDQAKIEEIMEKIGFDYREFPNGLKEKVGVTGKNCHSLSGGQWQKLAIARAVYKTSKLIILDEPTASLDPITESMIYTNYLKLVGDRTSILISHRLSATALVDRIILLKDGSIIDSGTHEDLIKNNALYSKMYNTQAKLFEPYL